MATQAPQSIGFFMRELPKFDERGRSYNAVMTFNSTAPQAIKIDHETSGVFAWQTVYIDNYNGAVDVLMWIKNTNQIIIAQAHSQGYYQVLGSPLEIDVEVWCITDPTREGQFDLRLIFINARLEPQVWGAPQVTVTLAPVQSQGSGHWPVTQVSVDNTAGGILLMAARAGRAGVNVTQLGTIDVWLGQAGVTTATGALLVGVKGASRFIPSATDIYGILGVAGPQLVSVEEFYP
jgi:hypothetical protein